jgi:protocatechuate 3,4-dioxygenase beta subunit
MHNDDRPVGHLLSRRRALAFFGASAVASVAQGIPGMPANRPLLAAAPDCIAMPEQTEGPYFVDRALERSDIRVDPGSGRTMPGVPLALQFELSQITPAGQCVVLPNAQFDIWHCDAVGEYSGVEEGRGSAADQMFLRGYQRSSEDGAVQFTTIYPGWYPGRAVHIHFKIRVAVAGGRIDEFTSQLYFTDELTDRVHAQEPYSSHRGQRLLNSRDMIFREGGSQLLLPVVDAEDGYQATFRIAMQPGESRKTERGRRPPRRG